MACRGRSLNVQVALVRCRFDSNDQIELRFGVQFHPEKNAFEHGRFAQSVAALSSTSSWIHAGWRLAA